MRLNGNLYDFVDLHRWALWIEANQASPVVFLLCHLWRERFVQLTRNNRDVGQNSAAFHGSMPNGYCMNDSVF